MIIIAAIDIAFTGILAAICAVPILLPAWLVRLVTAAVLCGTVWFGKKLDPENGGTLAFLMGLLPAFAWLVENAGRCEKCNAHVYGAVHAPLRYATRRNPGRELVWLDCAGGGHVFERETRKDASSGGSGGGWSNGGGDFSGGGGGSSGGGGADREY